MTAPGAAISIYGHYVSQPTRAVLWTLMMKSIPYTFVKINPQAGEADSDDYLKKFPSGVIPAYEERDTGFCLTESNAILIYLAQKHQWEDLLPQKDLQRNAKVHQWLHWHHSNLRLATVHIFRPVMLGTMGVERKPEAEQRDAKLGAKAMRDNMLVMTHGALKSSPYLTGESLTIADIAAYCELDQLVALKAFDFSKWPEVSQWLGRMQQLPHHDTIRRSLYKLAEMAATGKPSKL